jgi:hypothetical protein
MVVRVLAVFIVLLVAAGVVAWWGVATHMIRMDSPFASFDFRTYAIFSLIGEFLLGLPYAFSARALLRRRHAWSVASMWLAALAPGILITLLEVAVEGQPVFGPCFLLAAAVIAAGWQIIGIDRQRASANG